MTADAKLVLMTIDNDKFGKTIKIRLVEKALVSNLKPMLFGNLTSLQKTLIPGLILPLQYFEAENWL